MVFHDDCLILFVSCVENLQLPGNKVTDISALGNLTSLSRF
jgi:hypothetical protein